ncbi:MAG: hypothetical protein ACJAUG_000948, partial [Halioglobus sp.]
MMGSKPVESGLGALNHFRLLETRSDKIS